MRSEQRRPKGGSGGGAGERAGPGVERRGRAGREGAP